MTEYIFKYNKLLPLPEKFEQDNFLKHCKCNRCEKIREAFNNWLSTGIDLSPELKLEVGKVYREDVDFLIARQFRINGEWYLFDESKLLTSNILTRIIAIPVSTAQKEDSVENEGSYYYDLFKFFNNQHNLLLLDSEIQDIIHAVESFQQNEEKEILEHWKGEASHWYSEAHRLQKIIDENNYVPGASVDELAPVEQLIKDVCLLALAMQKQDRSLRNGQSLFNALDKINPQIANKIRGTDADPFYNNDRNADFFEAIKKLHSSNAAG